MNQFSTRNPAIRRIARRPNPLRQLRDHETARLDPRTFKIISWNLLHSVGASVADVAALARAEQPDLLLMQEATAELDLLPDILGGYYHRSPLPGRIHGMACWSRKNFLRAPRACALPSGALVRRVAQIINCGEFTVANVHLSHGQIMNRRQLHRISALVRSPSAILGDFNLVGPTLIPGFDDVGPRAPTHRMANIVPIRIDRCLVRGMHCLGTRVLPVFVSDHQPIMVLLQPDISFTAERVAGIALP